MTQGCPLAASLFVLAAEPATRLYWTTIPEMEGTYTYADDQATLLFSLDGLRKLRTPTKVTSDTLALDIHQGKTTLVPLATDDADPDAPIRNAQHTVRSLGAPWDAITIATHTGYLGYTIGPTANTTI